MPDPEMQKTGPGTGPEPVSGRLSLIDFNFWRLPG